MPVTLDPFPRPQPGWSAPDMLVVMDGAHQEPSWSLGRLNAMPDTPSADDLRVIAGLARDLADGAKLWRRAVTDPVSGVLLDYGTEKYLPDTLRRYIKARDGVCGTPICQRTSRLEMDHAEPFPAGTTSAQNCHAWCKTCHQLKTERRLRFTDTEADGSATLITAWGQRFSIPPRPFLHDPDDLSGDGPPSRDCAPPPDRPAHPHALDVDHDPPPF